MTENVVGSRRDAIRRTTVLTLVYFAIYFSFEGRALNDINNFYNDPRAVITTLDAPSRSVVEDNAIPIWNSPHHHSQSNTATKILAASEVPDSSTSTSFHRLLLGIFTTLRQKDEIRRKLIRKTYLSSYEILNKVDLAKDDEPSNRICSLNDLRNNQNNERQECRIVYTFVVGAAHPSTDKKSSAITTDLTYKNDTSIPYTLDRSMEHDYEQDVIYLNIRENMNDGKSVTWFHYASTILPAEELEIDLIAKVDTDTVLFPRPLLEDLDTQLHRQQLSGQDAQGVYGGFEEVANDGDDVRYMQGGFYFLSRDVARYLTSEACPRYEVLPHVKNVLHGHGMNFDRAEDLEIGCLVDHCWNNRTNAPSSSSSPSPSHIRKVLLDSQRSGDHDVPFKRGQGFRIKWKAGLSRDLAHLRLEQLQKDKYPTTGGCPTTTDAMETELKWFEARPHMIQSKERFSKFCWRRGSILTNKS